jgi:hypothetical protein
VTLDTYRLYKLDAMGVKTNEIAISDKDIAWPQDKANKYKNVDRKKQWKDVTDGSRLCNKQSAS